MKGKGLRERMLSFLARFVAAWGGPEARAYRETLFVLASAVLGVLAQPPFDLFFLAWIALVPLFLVLEHTTPRRAFAWGWCWGLMYMGAMFGWIGHVTSVGMVVFIAYLALYPALFAWGSRFLVVPHPLTRAIFLAAGWVVTEYLRAHIFSGFGWGLWGHSQYRLPVMIQGADVVGVYGVSFIVVLVNASLVLWYQRRTFDRQMRACAVLTAGIICLYLVYGVGASMYWQRQIRGAASEDRIRVAVVQPNVPDAEKWFPAYWEGMMDKLAWLSRSAGRYQPDVIIWPESSLPGYGEAQKAFADQTRALAAELGTSMLVGAVTQEGDHFYNSALLIDPGGDYVAEYRKLHLVPFGEYVPFRPWLNIVDKIVPIEDMSPGDESTVFLLSTPGARTTAFSSLICFEDTVRPVVRGMARAGARWLVNMTNDAWFKRSKASRLHLQAAVFVAVENRRYLVRAANTGISAIIDPTGAVVRRLSSDDGVDIFIPGQMGGEVVALSGLSVITKIGDVFTYLCFGCILWGVFSITIKNIYLTRRKKETSC